MAKWRCLIFQVTLTIPAGEYHSITYGTPLYMSPRSGLYLVSKENQAIWKCFVIYDWVCTTGVTGYHMWKAGTFDATMYMKLVSCLGKLWQSISNSWANVRISEYVVLCPLFEYLWNTLYIKKETVMFSSWKWLDAQKAKMQFMGHLARLHTSLITWAVLVTWNWNNYSLAYQY